VAILTRSDVCVGDEYPTPKNGTIKCIPYAGRSPSTRQVQDVIVTLIIVVGSILVFVQVSKFAYQLNKGSWDASLRAISQLENMAQDGMGPSSSPPFMSGSTQQRRGPLVGNRTEQSDTTSFSRQGGHW